MYIVCSPVTYTLQVCLQQHVQSQLSRPMHTVSPDLNHPCRSFAHQQSPFLLQFWSVSTLLSLGFDDWRCLLTGVLLYCPPPGSVYLARGLQGSPELYSFLRLSDVELLVLTLPSLDS